MQVPLAPSLTTRPELAVALTLKSGSPNSLFASAANAIVWAALTACAGGNASTVAEISPLLLAPPTAYSVPLMAATPNPHRGVDIDALGVHVLLPGSYASTVAKQQLLLAPPTAYSVPLMAATPDPYRGVDIDAKCGVHVLLPGS